jgi:hypothetical protein
MFQRGEDVLTMSFRQVWHAGRQRADEVLDAGGWSGGCRLRSLQVRFERHTDDGRRSMAEALGGSPERTTQLREKPDSNLIVHRNALR